MRKGTSTSKFGTSKRENHDSSLFYNSKLYQERTQKNQPTNVVENQVNADVLDRIYCSSSEKMTELPDNSVHLMVTSPPYNVSKEYDQNLSLDEYRTLLLNVYKEVYRVLVCGGRACINVANVGRKPYIPLHSYIIQDLLCHEVGFHMRGEIIWDKSASSGTSTAWGSWKSATNPTLRDTHEYILIFSKDTYSRSGTGKKNTISAQEFLSFTKSIWTFPTESAKRVGHPAPFPVELPYRLIQLYTFEDDVVLDPFMGSGATALASLRTNRHFIGYDTKLEYVELAEKRIKAEIAELKNKQEQTKPST
jgi:site-specific DNA-methyltransferase (adenine-specific)